MRFQPRLMLPDGWPIADAFGGQDHARQGILEDRANTCALTCIPQATAVTLSSIPQAAAVTLACIPQAAAVQMHAGDWFSGLLLSRSRLR